MQEKNLQKIKKLKIQLISVVFLLVLVVACGLFFPDLKKIALALNPADYNKPVGSQLLLDDWNRLDADFVAKSGDTMTGPLTLPADPVQNMQAATKQYVDNGGYVFTNWGRADCPAGVDRLYDGFTFGTKWDEPYGSGEILCIQSGSAGPLNTTTVRDKLWPVGTGVASYTPPGIATNREIKCAVCYKPNSVCYENVGSNSCAAGFNLMYSGYIMGGVTGIDNPNNKNKNSRHCVNVNLDGSTPNNTFASVYAGTVIVDNSDVPGYTTDSYIQCSICCN